MDYSAATNRYVTPDFKDTPLLALARLLKLSEEHINQLKQDRELYTPILCGIVLHRHLSNFEHQDVNRRIIEDVPPSMLQSKLRDLITSQRVQPFWYAWSLNDEELEDFYLFNVAVRQITDNVLPVDPSSIAGSLTVGGVATAVYEYSKKGPRASARDTIRSLGGTALVAAVSKKLGISPMAAKSAGIAAIPIMIVIAGLNIMAKNSSERAKRELAARGLLAYPAL